MSYIPFGVEPAKPETTPESSGARVLDLRTGREIEVERPAIADKPASVTEIEPTQPRTEVLSGEVLPALRRAAALPVIPDWLRSRQMAFDRVWWVARASGRVTLRWAVWSPVIVGRCVPPVARGTGRGVRGWYRWAIAQRLYLDAADIRGDASRQIWESARERARKARERRLLGSVIVIPAAGLAAWVWSGPWWAYAGAGAVAAVAAGVAGRREGEGILGIRHAPSRPVELGMPAGQLHATIGEVMLGLKLEVTVLRSRAHPWGWDVQIMAGQAMAKVVDKIDEIEARLRTRSGAISVIPDAGDAGLATLRIVWVDPYANMPAPVRRAPRSFSARGTHPIGRQLDGSPLEITLLTHTVYVGKSRSGKSSAIWTTLDILTAANDVVVWGGDLSDAPALNIWGDCVEHYRSTPEGLEGLLKAAIAVGMARAAVMGQRLRPTADSSPADAVDENWTPTPEAPALVLVLDEYPLIVEAGLGALVEEFLRTAAKGAGYAHIASQRAGRTEMGSTTVKTMAINKMLLACEAQDIEMLLGPGRRALGWRPDRLQPAADGKPNDAGRCYIDAPGHPEPRLQAVYRLDAPEVRSRAIERLRHIETVGRPRIDRATWVAADAYAKRRWSKGLDELLHGTVGESEPTGGGDDVRRLLDDVREAIEAAGSDRIRTAVLLDALRAAHPDRYADLDAATLSNQLRPHGVSPTQLGKFDGFANPQGYKLANVHSALESL
jgi:hypothetical protein